MVIVENLTKDFDSGFSLKNITVSIGKGEKVSLFGPNGAGKTTFLRILACLISPTSGSFTILGHPQNERIEILKHLNLAPQSGHFYETLTIKQNLEFYGKMYGLEKEESEKRINELLQKFDLSSKIDQPVSHLSKGMKQRLLIIKSLINSPQILLLDEPYSGLDVKSTEILHEYLNSFSDMTMITATHDFETGVHEGRRILIFNEGSIIFDGQWSESPEEFKNFYLKVIEDDKAGMGAGI